MLTLLKKKITLVQVIPIGQNKNVNNTIEVGYAIFLSFCAVLTISAALSVIIQQ